MRAHIPVRWGHDYIVHQTLAVIAAVLSDETS